MNLPNSRFQDQNLRISDFDNEVEVICFQCKKNAIAKVDFELNKARLLCNNCLYNKEVLIQTKENAVIHAPAHLFFNAELWLQAPFKNDVFWAYNQEHLEYLKQYISASLREHKNRSHFTLLEKLPKFYHEAKNRTALLKIIIKLASK